MRVFQILNNIEHSALFMILAGMAKINFDWFCIKIWQKECKKLCVIGKLTKCLSESDAKLTGGYNCFRTALLCTQNYVC